MSNMLEIFNNELLVPLERAVSTYTWCTMYEDTSIKDRNLQIKKTAFKV